MIFLFNQNLSKKNLKSLAESQSKFQRLTYSNSSLSFTSPVHSKHTLQISYYSRTYRYQDFQVRCCCCYALCYHAGAMCNPSLGWLNSYKSTTVNIFPCAFLLFTLLSELDIEDHRDDSKTLVQFLLPTITLSISIYLLLILKRQNFFLFFR